MMIGRHHGGKLLAGASLAALSRRTLATASVVAARGFAGEAAQGAKYLYSGPARGGAAASAWLRAPAIGMRRESTLALGEKEARPQQQQQQQQQTAEEEKRAAAGGKAIASYWGVEPSKVTRGDGTEWRWTCFRPTETYKADLSIDLKKHHAPLTFLDKLAFWTVKSMRYPTDIFFQRRYGCRAMMLETVAAVPGMVGGLLLHCKSLRRFEHSGGWIKALLEEAENERMHLMTFMEVSQPRWYERALVFAVQGVFFNAYFLGYLISPKFAHRVVGYLEEEAIHSYTEFLKELDNGSIENVPAPAIAIDYWQLPEGSTLRDVVLVVRADEAHHRDVNHFASDIHYQGRELKEAHAPLGYH
ncbi:hypothetical protein EUGRSUZ_E01213 [Eucalyptus grandis]|uniref:Ubiquinol oxidase n=3 Tax=Eucalyptus grandis TaxID=71139 RepID=A0A059C3C2_EUCGR|nr:hypothetical protein EUGRSUZ_E01213 [Eucalyptus grandis]KAK3429722.1 hypothetical protein EUGRSUZ_E01213 [Eucalyptus grandis]